MYEDEFLESWNVWAKANDWPPLEGEEFASPPLDILAYASRPIRLSRLPLFGRGLAVLAITRHPADLRSDTAGIKAWADRLARAVNGQFPPWKRVRPGAILLIAVQLTPEPIRGEDEDRFKPVLGQWTGTRVVPSGIIRINLGQQAMASVLAEGLPRDLPEIARLVDDWSTRFSRFVPMWAESEKF
ncbi:MAG: hypothetical protein ACKO0V_20385 [bacterium]